MNRELEFIFNRRSIRKYQAKKVDVSLLNDLLEAAMAAPSAVARDPWHFLVLTERNILDQVANLLPHGRMLRQAPAAFIVCGDINQAHDRQLSYLLQDLAAATENILLAATRLGLGSCWLGIHPRPERIADIRELFQLPSQIIPMCGIALGWPAEDAHPRSRFNKERVHWQTWQRGSQP